jgi:general secretion pathway protein K
MALILGSVQRLDVADARAAHGRAMSAELGAAADTAVDIAIMRMLGPEATAPPVDGSPFALDFNGVRARVSVQDEAGKIDINRVDAPLLRRLLVATGLEDAAAQQMTDRIMDWREPSIGRRLNGAKADDYRDAGLPYGPRDAPFQSVAELQFVIGMTPALYDRIAPLLTVYSQAASVTPGFATAPVLAVLSAIDPNAAAVLRRQEDARAGLESPAERLGVVIGHAFTIQVDIAVADGSRTARTAVIRLTGLAGAPLWVYRWD